MCVVFRDFLATRWNRLLLGTAIQDTTEKCLHSSSLVRWARSIFSGSPESPVQWEIAVLLMASACNPIFAWSEALLTQVDKSTAELRARPSSETRKKKRLLEANFRKKFQRQHADRMLRTSEFDVPVVRLTMHGKGEQAHCPNGQCEHLWRPS